MTRDIEALRAVLGQHACRRACGQNLRQDVTKLPWESVGRDEIVELLDHVGPVVPGLGIDGYHARCVADSQHLLAGELPVDIAGQGGEIGDLGDMLLLVQDGLVQVGDAPAQGNVVNEQLREGRCGLTGIGVAPGAEGDHEVAFLVERHVAVHHGADADGGEMLDLHVIALADIVAQVSVAVLQAEPDGFVAVGPKAVHELVFPLVAALCDRNVILVHQHRLDAGGTELDAEDGFSGFDGSSCVHLT